MTTTKIRYSGLSALVLLISCIRNGTAFLTVTPFTRQAASCVNFGDVTMSHARNTLEPLYNSASLNDPEEEQNKDKVSVEEEETAAATNTVNERLMAELEEATQKEKFGARSSVGRKLGMDGYGRPRKTPEEYERAIAEARDLNGVNPVVAIVGSLFALLMAGGLWFLTNYLGEWFAMHPVESTTYFIQRVSLVFRNVVMGLVSLASGFFGVTGIGILLLGVRVAYGVAKGELDPTPIAKKKQEFGKDQDGDLVLPNVWDLMMGKKKRKGNDNNDKDSFGL